MSGEISCKLILKKEELNEAIESILNNDFKEIYASGDIFLDHLKKKLGKGDTKKIKFIGHSYVLNNKNQLRYIYRSRNIEVRINSLAVQNLLVSENQLLLLAPTSGKGASGFITNNEDEVKKARTYLEELWNKGYSLYFGERDKK